MKRKLLVALFLLLFSTGAFAAEPWRVGVSVVATGPAAVYGVRMLAAVQWWERDINASGGIRGRPVEVLVCDDQANPEKAVTCARDLLGKGVVVLMSLSNTGPARAVMPLVANGPIMLVPSPTILPPADSYVFQVAATDHDVTQAIANYLKANSVKKLGMVLPVDAVGETAAQSAREVFPPAGIELLIQRIDTRSNDASIQLSAVANSDVPVIYTNYPGGGAVTVVKSYANLGLTQPLIVSNANASDAFIALVKDNMPSRLMVTVMKAAAPELLADPVVKAHVEHFYKSYEEWKHERADALNLLGLVAADTAEAVLRNVENPADAVAARKYLETTPVKSIETLHFSPDRHIGLDTSNYAVLELKNGRWAPADPLK